MLIEDLHAANRTRQKQSHVDCSKHTEVDPQHRPAASRFTCTHFTFALTLLPGVLRPSLCTAALFPIANPCSVHNLLLAPTLNMAGNCPTCMVAGGALMGEHEGALWSTTGEYRFTMQSDGNLVLYRGGAPIWASGTNGQGNCYFVLQGDGNAVVYNKDSGAAIWASGTNGKREGPFKFVMQDDGNAVQCENNTG